MNERNEERGREIMAGNGISLLISAVALVVSIASVIFNLYYANKEYEYKMDSEVEVTGKIGLQVHQSGTGYNEETFLEDMQVRILQKNNLQNAYLIYPNNIVEELVIDDMEERLLSEFHEELKVNKADLAFGDTTYQYVFLLLKGLDDTTELYLVYAKSNSEIFNFQSVSGIEIWGLANSHPDEPGFKGEKVMAAQYEKIMKDSEKYIF